MTNPSPPVPPIADIGEAIEHHPYCSIHDTGKCDCQSPFVTPAVSREFNKRELALLTVTLKMHNAWMRHAETLAKATGFDGIAQAADHMDEAFDLIPELRRAVDAILTGPRL